MAGEQQSPGLHVDRQIDRFLVYYLRSRGLEILIFVGQNEKCAAYRLESYPKMYLEGTSLSSSLRFYVCDDPDETQLQVGREKPGQPWELTPFNCGKVLVSKASKSILAIKTVLS